MIIERQDTLPDYKWVEKPTKPMRIFCPIHFFPGFEGYEAGGAERFLQREITFLTKNYASDYRMTVYVLNRQKDYSGEIFPEGVNFIGKTSKRDFLGFLLREQKNYDLLQISDGINWPSKRLIGELILWRKPIIGRIAGESNLNIIEKMPQILRKNLFDKITTVIAISPEIEYGLRKLGIPAEKIAYIANGTDTDLFKPADDNTKTELRKRFFGRKISDGKKIFIYHGRIMDRLKRVGELLKIFIESGLGKAGHALVLIGPNTEDDPQIRSKIEEYINSGEQNNIFWFGSKIGNEIAEYLQAADFFVLPSEKEGMSNSLLEAMSSGLFPIVRDGVSGTAVVENGTSGYKFKGDEDLGRVMVELANSSGDFSQITRNARELIVRDYSLELMVRRYDQLYRKVLGRS